MCAALERRHAAKSAGRNSAPTHAGQPEKRVQSEIAAQLAARPLPDCARYFNFRRCLMRKLSFGRAASLALVMLLLCASVASADTLGFFTSQSAMLTPVAAGSTVAPIISVGDTLPTGYRFEALPDGIAVLPNGEGTVDVFVNHETSLVPFPLAANIATCTSATCQSDFDNAQVSRLRLHQASAGVLAAEMAITSASNYQRFCSSFMADGAVGFRRPILFTNEEATDFVSPPPLQAWPAAPGNQRQAGLVVAHDARNGKTVEIPGMGRMNHENTIFVPGGWDKLVAVTGDDTFNAPSSQFYMYMADSDDDVLADQGSLYAFVADNPAINDYGDIISGMSVSGHFIPVPRDIAIGDQTPLENWSNANNVFQFIRIEDLDYDKLDPRIVYFADTGEPRAIPDPATGRLRRGPSGTLGPYPNGRIFKMVFNVSDPTVVDSLSILINGDAGSYNNFNALHNPDNVGVSASSLMITEDPGSHNSYAVGSGGPTARVWRYDLVTGALTVAAAVDQSADPAARLGAWEAAGVIDVSSSFGPGTWLINVQAHTLYVESETRTVTLSSGASGPVLFKREGGQLLLLTVPGS
jgi:hypothetical protein